MRKTITESQLRQIVKESIKRVLREDEFSMGVSEFYDTIDERLERSGDAHISRFYSDGRERITVAANVNIGRQGRENVADIMLDLGYRLHDTGSNGDYIMMEFIPE